MGRCRLWCLGAGLPTRINRQSLCGRVPVIQNLCAAGSQVFDLPSLQEMDSRESWCVQADPPHCPIPLDMVNVLEVVVSILERNDMTSSVDTIIIDDLLAESASAFVDLAPKISSRRLILAAVIKVVFLFE